MAFVRSLHSSCPVPHFKNVEGTVQWFVSWGQGCIQAANPDYGEEYDITLYHEFVACFDNNNVLQAALEIARMWFADSDTYASEVVSRLGELASYLIGNVWHKGLAILVGPDDVVLSILDLSVPLEDVVERVAESSLYVYVEEVYPTQEEFEEWCLAHFEGCRRCKRIQEEYDRRIHELDYEIWRLERLLAELQARGEHDEAERVTMHLLELRNEMTRLKQEKMNAVNECIEECVWEECVCQAPPEARYPRVVEIYAYYRGMVLRGRDAFMIARNWLPDWEYRQLADRYGRA